MSEHSTRDESIGLSIATQIALADEAASAQAPAQIAAPVQHPPEIATLISGLDRLEKILDEETAALEAREAFDLQEMNRRKSRSLLELSRASRLMPQVGVPELEERVLRLRGKLQRNSEVLAIHLAAAREISSILTGAMRAAESDGTYSTHLAGGRGA